MNNEIDFIIAWVDGNDEKWQLEKEKYVNISGDKTTNRYREWGTLKYWFRGVEQFAPWVHKIHFVTWGHLPEWLNTEHPKLNIVNHKDYIPKKYLPTFNSHTIELNFHRIKNLAENFVYFNDDMYIINPVNPEDFFVNKLPCDIAALYPAYVNGESTMFDHILLNDSEFFARHFDIKNVMKQNRSIWFSPKYKKNLLKTICMLPFPNFTGILLTHQPASLKKQTFLDVWETEEILLDKTCKNKFRTREDVNQYIFRYWQLGQGNIYPYNIIDRGSYLEIGQYPQDYKKAIVYERKKMLCLNDTDIRVSFETESQNMINAFEMKFPNKSKFEL